MQIISSLSKVEMWSVGVRGALHSELTRLLVTPADDGLRWFRCTKLALSYDLLVLFYPWLWIVLLLVFETTCIPHSARTWLQGAVIPPSQSARLFFVSVTIILWCVKNCQYVELSNNNSTMNTIFLFFVCLPLSREHVARSRWSMTNGKAALKRLKWNFSDSITSTTIDTKCWHCFICPTGMLSVQKHCSVSVLNVNRL